MKKGPSKKGTRQAKTAVAVAAPSEQIDPELERRLDLVVLIIIVILLLCVIIIPGSWLNSASMWCREHIPGF